MNSRPLTARARPTSNDALLDRRARLFILSRATAEVAACIFKQICPDIWIGISAQNDGAGLTAGGPTDNISFRRIARTAGYLTSGSELGRQVAVDFESDADFHECGSCPVHSRLPISSQRSSITRPSSRSTVVVTVRRNVVGPCHRRIALRPIFLGFSPHRALL